MLDKRKRTKHAMVKELMPEDEDKVERIDNIVSEILRLLKGDSFAKDKGLIERFFDFEGRLILLERGYKKIYTLIIGIGIGIGIAAVFFGGLTLKALIDIVK